MDDSTTPAGDWTVALTPARSTRRRPDPLRVERRPPIDAETALAGMTHALTQLERTVDRLVLRIARLEERLQGAPPAEPAREPLRRGAPKPAAAATGDDA